MAAKDDYLLDLLMDMGVVTHDQVAQARQEAEAGGAGVVDTLLARRWITPQDVTNAKAVYFGAEVVQLADLRIEDSVISSLRRDLAKRYRAIPIYKHGNTMAVALADPSDLDTIDALHHALKMEIEVKVASEAEIDAALSKYYGAEDDQVGMMIQNITEGDVAVQAMTKAAGEDDGSVVESDAPIIRLVNNMIVEAFKMRASDIHLEPLSKSFRVRYRIDGVLHEIKGPPKKLQASIISRIKIMSNMSIAERRIPQDGRIQTSVGGKMIDLRVSCIPTNHGESIVMRILDKEGLRLGLPELGFFTDDQQTFERLIGLPDGIILVTGPTGSGKTTTLYSVLNFINRPDRKIITVEDPVEYLLSGINQVQVNEIVGLTFATALRAMLRQAPNIIMIGEIRDLETASIAINASLTGHLVFSTLHTNDAPSAVTRLIDIGVKPFLVASSTRAIMAQRLVRKVCKRCAAPYEPTEHERRVLNLDPNTPGANFLKGRGCGDCNKTGYRGRMGIFEIFVVDDEARKLIYEKVQASILRARARETGMRTLREDGTRKVLAGLTTPDEVIRATLADVD
ncbi:type II secretion system ATPase GspE [Fontisphaera persica]|uniref:type II secretion system ATPase GspE n=1 Tax=Fontisphaera persica TaxID=2974023 RepID=UPI0024BF4CCD|nr:type II secretion system ATPase GspE [Fontisphaera persica]WCJ60553.1 type II secretion system ATPase GspE [Fontisphaera persica]